MHKCIGKVLPLPVLSHPSPHPHKICFDIDTNFHLIWEFIDVCFLQGKTKKVLFFYSILLLLNSP